MRTGRVVATDAYYASDYQCCDFCGGDGCCVCDHFGVLHKDHPLFQYEGDEMPDWQSYVDQHPTQPRRATDD